MSSADNFCKQFGPRSGLTKCQAWSGSNLLDTLMVFLKINFWKGQFWKKINKRQKGMQNFSVGKELFIEIKEPSFSNKISICKQIISWAESDFNNPFTVIDSSCCLLPWVKVFRINPEFRILRLSFHRKSASKFWIKEIIIASLVSFKII